MINTAALFSDFLQHDPRAANCLQIKAASTIAAGRTARKRRGTTLKERREVAAESSAGLNLI